MKDEFNKIIKEIIAPILKKNGFKKKGLNFYRNSEQTQQIINFQKSRGNSFNNLKFYINCGVLINNLTDSSRELKSESEADIRKRIQKISNYFQTDGISLNINTNAIEFGEKLSKSFKEDLIPFFDKLSSENNAIIEMVTSNGLYKYEKLINYLCVNDKTELLITYIKNVKNILTRIDNIDRRNFFIQQFKKQISSYNLLSIKLEKLLEKESV